MDDRRGEIAQMQSELLYGKFNDEATTAEGVRFIQSIPGGNSAHRAGALKVALKEGLNRVFLLCSRPGCDFHYSATPYCLIGPKMTICPRDHVGKDYLECASCGARRYWDHESCKGCGKWYKQTTHLCDLPVLVP